MSFLPPVLAIVAVGIGQGADADAATIQLIIDSHRQIRESVSNLYVKLTFENVSRVKDFPYPATKEWWQTPRAWKAVSKFSDGSIVEEMESDAGYKRSNFYPRSDGSVYRNGALGTKHDRLFETPWYYTKIEGDNRRPAAEYLLRDKVTRTLNRSDPKAIVVTLESDSGGWKRTERFEYDARAPYLPRRVTVTNPDGIFIDRSFAKAVEFKPGIHLPTVMEYCDEKRTTVIRLTDVRINEPIPDSIFVVKFAKGTNVTDDFKKLQYIVDENEQIANTPSPLPEPKFADLQVRFPTGDPRSPTFYRRNRVEVWIGAGLLLAIAIGGLVYWRRRKIIT